METAPADNLNVHGKCGNSVNIILGDCDIKTNVSLVVISNEFILQLQIMNFDTDMQKVLFIKNLKTGKNKLFYDR